MQDAEKNARQGYPVLVPDEMRHTGTVLKSQLVSVKVVFDFISAVLLAVTPSVVGAAPTPYMPTMISLLKKLLLTNTVLVPINAPVVDTAPVTLPTA